MPSWIRGEPPPHVRPTRKYFSSTWFVSIPTWTLSPSLRKAPAIAFGSVVSNEMTSLNWFCGSTSFFAVPNRKYVPPLGRCGGSVVADSFAAGSVRARSSGGTSVERSSVASRPSTELRLCAPTDHVSARVRNTVSAASRSGFFMRLPPVRMKFPSNDGYLDKAPRVSHLL